MSGDKRAEHILRSIVFAGLVKLDIKVEAELLIPLRQRRIR